MKKVKSQYLRSIKLDNGIHLCHEYEVQSSRGNLGVHFYTQSTPILSYKKRESLKWQIQATDKITYLFLGT